MQGRSEELVVAAEEAGERLDRVLAARVAELSRSRHKALILAGRVAIDGATIRDPDHRVNAGGTIVLDLPPPEELAIGAEDIPLEVVFEDDELIVIDKPAGLVVHPAAGNWTGTLVNALVAHCGETLSGVGGVKRPGIVHRLDKDTTGLMVVAKTDRAHRALSAQFADHGRTGPLRRGYLAFVWGAPDRPRGTIDKPIDRHPRARDKMAVREGGREAITHWEVLETVYRHRWRDRRQPPGLPAGDRPYPPDPGPSRRVGHPLLGDDVYGGGFKTKANQLGPEAGKALEALGRQALHAYLLTIEHPSQGKNLEFRSELPDDLRRLRHGLGDRGKSG